MIDLIIINIIYIREYSRYNQKDFANLFSITQTTLSNYERGKSEPSLTFVINVCKHFDLSLDDFVYKNLSKQSSFTNNIYKNEQKIEYKSTKEPDENYFSDKIIENYERIIKTKEETLYAKNGEIESLRSHVKTLQILLNQNLNES